MPTYRYEAMDTTGTEIRDEIEADNQNEAQEQIRKMGFFVTKIRLKEPPVKLDAELAIPSGPTVEPDPRPRKAQEWTQAHDELIARYPRRSMWSKLRHPNRYMFIGWLMFLLPTLTAVGLYCVDFVEGTPPWVGNFVHLAMICMWLSYLIGIPALLFMLAVAVGMKLTKPDASDEDRRKKHEYFMLVYQARGNPLVKLVARLGHIILLFTLVLTGYVWTTVFFVILMVTASICLAGSMRIMKKYIEELSPEEIAELEALVAAQIAAIKPVVPNAEILGGGGKR